MLVIYYSVLSLFFIFAGAETDAFNNADFDNPLNSSELQTDEIDTGGLFGSGVSFGRFFVFVTAGFGLPDDTPVWFQIMFSTWSILFLIFTVGFLISSIWNG